jgi:hypothetical protein
MLLHRTGFNTVSAAGALLSIHASGPFPHPYGKTSGPAGNRLQFRKGQKLYISVPAGFHKLGRQNAHGTIICGKGFVELRHGTAYGGLIFHQIDFIS